VNIIKLRNIELENGEVLGYRECGESENTVVLLHGNMTSSKHFDLLMLELIPKYKVYAIDLRGFGVSTYNNPIDSLKEFANDVEEVIEKLDINRFILAGWSTGGGIAMHIAADMSKRIKKLILIDSVGISGYPIFKKDQNGAPILTELLKTKEDIKNDLVQVKPVLDALKNKDKEFYRQLFNMIIYNVNKPDNQKYEEYLDDMLTQRNLVDVDYALTRFNISNNSNGLVEGTGEVEKIECPTIVVQGDKDLVVPIQMAQGIVNGIGINAHLEIFENSGHNPMVDNLGKVVELF